MKNLLYILFAFALFTACDKLPDDSDLDGMWQLTSIEHAGTNTDVKSQRIYWSFRLRLIQFTNVGDAEHKKEFFAHSEHNGNTLNIYDLCNPSENATAADNNEWMDTNERDLTVLAQWGIYPETDTSHKGKLKVCYSIEKATSSSLTLSNSNTKLKFRKY